jgi:hypothetical protein
MATGHVDTVGWSMPYSASASVKAIAYHPTS